MDSPIPDEFVGRYVASTDMMCATTMILPEHRQSTAFYFQQQYEQRVKEHEDLRRKIEHERKIREAQKNPLNRLLRWFKKVCGSHVIEI